MNYVHRFEADINGRKYFVDATKYCAFVSVIGDAGGGMIRKCGHSTFFLNKEDTKDSILKKLTQEVNAAKCHQSPPTCLSLILEGTE